MPIDYFKTNLGAGLVSVLMRLTLPAVNMAVLYLSLWAYGIIGDATRSDDYLALALVAFLLSFIFTQRDFEDPGQLLTSGRSVAERVALRWCAVAAVLLLIGYLGGVSDTYSRRVLLTWFIVTPPAAIALHILLRAILRNIVVNTGAGRTAVIAGVNAVSRLLAKRISQHPEFGIRLLGGFDDRDEQRLGECTDLSLLGRLSDLPGFTRLRNVDVIFIAIPISHVERVHSLLSHIQDTTASVYFVPDIFVIDLIQSRPGEIGGVPVVALCESPFYGMRGVLKRMSDIALASIMLLLASPVMLAIAIALRLTTSQSIIFKQRRYGLGGEEIVVYKFRTMSTSDDGDTVNQASRGDPRVTPVGRILRRYSLDELPQLINVLQGRMSVIGPRPHAVAHNEEYRQLIAGYMVRHKVSPGITGLAQVNGCRGETATLDDMAKRIRYDLQYLRDWSLALDMKILLRTILTVFRHEKAY